MSDRSGHHWGRSGHHWGRSGSSGRRSCGGSLVVTDFGSSALVVIWFPHSSAKYSKDDRQDNDKEDPEGLFPRVAEILKKSATTGLWSHVVFPIVQFDRRGFYKGDVIVGWLLTDLVVGWRGRVW